MVKCRWGGIAGIVGVVYLGTRDSLLWGPRRLAIPTRGYAVQPPRGFQKGIAIGFDDGKPGKCGHRSG